MACPTRLRSLPLLVRCSLAVLLVVGSKNCSANGHRCPPSTSTWRLLVSLFPKLCSVAPKRRLIAGSASLVPAAAVDLDLHPFGCQIHVHIDYFPRCDQLKGLLEEFCVLHGSTFLSYLSK